MRFPGVFGARPPGRGGPVPHGRCGRSPARSGPVPSRPVRRGQSRASAALRRWVLPRGGRGPVSHYCPMPVPRVSRGLGRHRGGGGAAGWSRCFWFSPLPRGISARSRCPAQLPAAGALCVQRPRRGLGWAPHDAGPARMKVCWGDAALHDRVRGSSIPGLGI